MTLLKRLKPIFPILILVLFLRLPSLFEPNRYADEDIYLTLGLGLRRGLVFYKDIHDNKPPLLYLLAALAGNVFWFRFFLLIWHSINVSLIYFLSQKFFKNKTLHIIATLVFAVFSTIPSLEGEISNGEIFMIMPATAAILAILDNKPRFFWVGFLFSISFLFKIPIVFDFFAVFFWFFFINQAPKKIFSTSTLVLISAFFAPILISLGYYSLKGAGYTYLRSALMQNIGYLGSWAGDNTGLFIRAGILTLIFAVIYLFRNSLGKKLCLLLLWSTAALFGALLSGRPYPHYLLQIIPPFSLLLVTLAINKDIFKNGFVLFLFALTIFSVKYYQFWGYPTFSYYQNFIRFVTKKIDRGQFDSFWSPKVLTNQQVGEFIKHRTKSDDRILVWGNEPAVYVLSDRLPVGKYTVAYHVIDFKGQDQLIDNLKSNPAKFIVYYPNAPKFDQLDQFIAKFYFITEQFDSALIFEFRQ